MFEQMKAMGALAGLMKNKERLAEVGEEFKRRVERISAQGEAGGGAVRVEVSGKMRVTSVRLDPSLLAGAGSGDEGRELAESLVREAVNDAVEQAQAMLQHEAQRMARELDLPELPGIERLLGSG